MKLTYLIASAFFSLWNFSLHAQFKFDYDPSIPVKIGNDTLLFPWAGGLNYAQISSIDFDFDGDLDLFVFDRSKDNIRLFETIENNGVKSYKPVINGKLFFPSDLKNRVALVDYDLDGKKDIFTYGIGGVKVYKNMGNPAQGLQWQLISELLYSNYFGNETNLYVSSSDIPAYIDVDNDSDLDILTFHIGGERVEYHQNQSIELYGHNDSLVFVLKNECWGKFTEDPNNNSIILNNPNNPCAFPNIPDPQKTTESAVLDPIQNPVRHAGSTLLALDIDNSGVLDLILGDVAHTNLVLLTNGGTAPNTNSAMITQDENFPSNTTPANMSIFPASFYEDVDFDGIKDLLVGANAKGVSQNEKSILYYKNLGQNNLPVFQFKTNAFLQDDMIDVGTGSVPVFFDQNGDGKSDLLVANFYRYKEPLSKESALVAYRNVGTAENPSFTFLDNNYLNVTAQNYGLRTIPTFGDLDSDGDQDLMLGLENGTLVYQENTASNSTTATFGAPQVNYTDQAGNIITTGSYCFPQLFDLDKDGLLDLILGKKTGELMYYKNVGTASNPAFELITTNLGGIDVSPSTPEGYAAPHFFRWNDTTHLFLGSNDGKLHFYSNIDGNINDGDSFTLISDNFRGIDVEGYSSFFVNDLNNNGKMDLFIGGDLGGILHYEHNPNSVLTLIETETSPEMWCYPNPANDLFFVQLETASMQTLRVSLIDVQGKEVFSTQAETSENGIARIACSLGRGIYYARIFNQTTGKTNMLKLVIQH